MSKTFRLFVSSTFNDFRVERDILHKEIFPEVEAYAKEKGCEFQPVDLRWGINAEAQNDQKTLELCLEEVRACKSLPHPNFLILTGDRYGWIPLPFYIEKTEFEKIEKEVEQYEIVDCIKNESNKKAEKEINDTKISALKLLKQWYKLDENQVPASYRLQEREGDFTHWKIWETEEKKLRGLLQTSVKSIFTSEDKNEKDKEVLKNEEYYKYFLSATEQEAIEGIGGEEGYRWETFNQKDEEYKKRAIDKEYVIALFRDLQISKGADKHEKLKDFKEESKELNTLREGLKKALNEKQTLHVKPSLIEEDKELNVSYTKEEKDNFKAQLAKILKTQIDNELARTEDIASLKQENQEQKRYKKEKLKSFVGREKSINRIEDYINNNSNAPFIVHGRSGMGKSSLMAKVIDKNELSNDIIYRFVGASVNSTSIRKLQESILEELIKNGVIEEFEFEEDSNKFNQQIRDILSTNILKKTVIFIDAIDQLKEKDYLTWLPNELHKNLKVIISVLKDKYYEEDTHYFNTLKSRYKKAEESFLDISDDLLNEDEIEKAINSMLESEHRTITKKQMEYVKKQCKKVDYSPLYLKIASQELKNWKSYDKKEDTELEDTVKDIIEEYIDNLSDIHHHEKTFVDKVFSYIHVSKYGLSEKELLNILSEDLEDDKEFREVMLNEFHDKLKKENPLRDNKEELILPISIWVRLQTQLKPFILETNTDGQNLMKFFHRQFTSVAEKRYKKQKGKTHRRLAEFFNEHQDKTKTWDERYNYVHSLSELPYHLYYSNQKKETKNLLLDLEFVGSVYDSQKEEDFKEILYLQEDEKLEMVKSFYREKEHLIKRVNTKEWRAHQSLFQLAYEDGLNSILTTKAEELLKQNKVNFAWLKREWRDEKYTRSGLLKVMKEHKDKITGTIQLKNENILSYSNDKTLCLWSKDGELINVMEGHNRGIGGAIQLKNENILTSGGTLRLWSKDGELISVMEGYYEIQLKNENILTSSGSTLRLWNKDGELIRVMEGHSDEINSVIQLKNENILSWASSSLVSKDKTLHLWDKDGELISVMEGHSGLISGAIQLKNENILSYSFDKTLRLWSKDGELISVMEGHNRGIREVIQLKNENILSYSYDKTLRLWSKDGELISVMEGHSDDIIGVIQFKNENILSYSYDKTLRLWSKDGELISIMEGHSGKMNSAIQLKNENILTSSGKTLRLWSKDGELISIMEGHSGYINGVIQLKNENILSYSYDKTLRLWSKDGELISVVKGHIRGTAGAIQLKNENILTSSGSTLRLWSKDGELISVMEKHSDDIIRVIQLKNENILSYSNDKTLCLWSKDGELISVMEEHSDWINGAIQLKNENILSYSWDKTLCLWSKDGELISVMEGHNRGIGGAIQLKNENILSYSNDKTLRLWNKDGELISVMKGHSDDIIGVIQLKNENILSYSNDKTLRLWDKDGELISVMKGHNRGIRGVIQLKNENILSYSNDKTLRLWDKDGELISVIEEHNRGIGGVKQLKNENILSWTDDILDLSDNTLSLWSKDGKFISVMEGHSGLINGVIQLNNENILSWTSSFPELSDYTLCLWSKDGELISIYNFSNDQTPSIEKTFSDDKCLISFGRHLSMFTLIEAEDIDAI